MPTKQFFTKQKLVPTETGFKVMQARFSLKETQTEFAKRFMVTKLTVHKWETGKTRAMPPIYRHMLNVLLKRLSDEGRLLPKEVIQTMFRTELERQQERELVAASV